MELFREKFFPHQPNIATTEHLHERYNEWRSEQKAVFSSPSRQWAHETNGITDGFSPLILNGSLYFIRQSTPDLRETIRLDANGRKKEHWYNWDTPHKSTTRWTHDEEGFITKIEYLKGTGQGHDLEVVYQRDDNGRYLKTKNGMRVPEYLIIQYFTGDPIKSWQPRTLERGEDDGEPIHIDLLGLEIKT